MLKRILRTSALFLSAALIAGGPLQVSAQTTNRTQTTNQASATKQPPAAQKAAQTIPFQGTIAAIDKVAKTITVGKRVFKVTSETRIFKADKKTPALFEDAVVADHITGSYTKADDGSLAAKSLYFGVVAQQPKAASPSPTPVPAPATKK